MMVIVAELCVVICILFGIFVGFVFSNIVISWCGDRSRLLIVFPSCDVLIVLLPASVEICTPVLCFRWGCDPVIWLSCTVISSIPSSEPSSEELIVIIVGVGELWVMAPEMDGSLLPMIVVWALLGCAWGFPGVFPCSSIVVLGPGFSSLPCPRDVLVIGASQGCLLVDCIGLPCSLVPVSVWISCGSISSLFAHGCGCVFSVLGLSSSVAMADVCSGSP